MVHVVSSASQRRSASAHGGDHSDLDSQESRFLTDLYMLIMASSQADVFERDWLSFAGRVHWLKARHLAFLVTEVAPTLESDLSIITHHSV